MCAHLMSHSPARATCLHRMSHQPSIQNRSRPTRPNSKSLTHLAEPNFQYPRSQIRVSCWVEILQKMVSAGAGGCSPFLGFARMCTLTCHVPPRRPATHSRASCKPTMDSMYLFSFFKLTTDSLCEVCDAHTNWFVKPFPRSTAQCEHVHRNGNYPC